MIAKASITLNVPSIFPFYLISPGVGGVLCVEKPIWTVVFSFSFTMWIDTRAAQRSRALPSTFPFFH